MSETTQNTTGACEQLLDYVYGELDEAGKRAFEEHLPGCARCQAEVKSFGRVRTAAKRLMPSVEPTASLGGGALHAQLMHAAAQRQPRRGVLLAFPRKIIEHPAWAAAAMFAIVGSAVALNWSRGKMAMPVASDESKAESPAPVVTTTPAAEPMPAAKNKEEEAGKALGAVSTGKSGADYKDTQIALDTPSGRMKVQRPATHAAGAATAAKLAAPPPMKKVAATGGKRDVLDDGLASDGRAKGVAGGGVADVEGAPKSSAPENDARKLEVATKERQKQGYVSPSPAKPSPARAEPQPSWGGNNPAAPPPPQAAVASPMPVTESTTTGREQNYYRGKAQSSVQGPAQQAKDLDALHKRFLDLATTGRYEEAIKVFQELQKRTSFITASERAHYVRCLTAAGREEQAQQALDELKQDKSMSNAELLKAENELANRRRTTVEKKAKKSPAAPADRHAADQVQQQQRPAEAPVQAAPPARSDDKKSQKSY